MLEHVCQLARNAGDAIMQVYDGIKPMEITSKQDDSPGHGGRYRRAYGDPRRITGADAGYSGSV